MHNTTHNATRKCIQTNVKGAILKLRMDNELYFINYIGFPTANGNLPFTTVISTTLTAIIVYDRNSRGETRGKHDFLGKYICLSLQCVRRLC